MRVILDAAYLPPNPVGGAVGAAGYIGYSGPSGAYHIWTADDWARARTQYRYLLPVAVPPAGMLPATMASLMVTWARQNGQPPGTCLALDREENRADLDSSWVDTWVGAIKASGWKPVVYGDTSTLAAADAYRWLADPNLGAPPLEDLPGLIEDVDVDAVQWLFGDGYDLSSVSDPMPLWEPGVTPTPAPTPDSEEPPMAERNTLIVTATGDNAGAVHAGDLFAVTGLVTGPVSARRLYLPLAAAWAESLGQIVPGRPGALEWQCSALSELPR
jgi:hypothetical protein